MFALILFAGFAGPTPPPRPKLHVITATRYAFEGTADCPAGYVPDQTELQHAHTPREAYRAFLRLSCEQESAERREMDAAELEHLRRLGFLMDGAPVDFHQMHFIMRSKHP